MFKYTHADFVQRLISHAEDPHKVCLVLGESDRRTTYSELSAAVDSVTNLLLGAGLQSGHRVVLIDKTTDAAVICILAVIRAGGVVVPVNPAASAAELEHYLFDSASSFILSNPAHATADVRELAV